MSQVLSNSAAFSVKHAIRISTYIDGLLVTSSFFLTFERRKSNFAGLILSKIGIFHRSTFL